MRHRLFTSMDDDGRVRRASDLTTALLSIAVLSILGAAAVPPAGFETSLITFAGSLPPALNGVWRVLADLPVLVAIVLLIAAVIWARTTLLVDLIVAAAVVILGTSVVGRIVTGAWPGLSPFARLATNLSSFPAARLALMTTVVATSSPHLIRPIRRLCRWIIGLSAVSLVALGSATPTGATAGILIAVAAAAITRSLLGSTHARPSLDDVRAALDALGVTPRTLDVAADQQPGRFLLDGIDDTGMPLLVKVYGRDADDTQFLRVLWRTLWYRGPVGHVAVGRVQQVQNEAFLTLMARNAGVHTHDVVTAGLSIDGDAVLALTTLAEPLSAHPSEFSDERAHGAWRTLAKLHDRQLIHGRLDDEHLVLSDDGSIGIIDFHGATVASTPEPAQRDRAQLLVTTALALDTDRAVAVAQDELGPAALTDVLPFVQMASLTRRQRIAVDDTGLDLDEFRERAAELTGGESPQLRKLQRISVRTIVQLALAVVAFFALSAAFGDLDFALLAREVRDGIWWWIAIGFVLVQIGRFPQGMATAGASPQPIPLGPVYVLQLALSYIGLALPGSAARFAVNVRFLQRQGLPSGTAIAVSGLDSVWWFAVQISLVLGILFTTSLSLDVDLGSSVGGVSRILSIVGAIAVLAIALLLAVPRWRRPAFEWIRQLAAEARQATEGMASPRRLGMLVGGNLTMQLLFALALGSFSRALGFNVGFVELLLINVSVSLLAGVLPVPGGIGIVEGGLAIGLIRAGLPEEAAFATALLYRISTFYLPPAWGFFALRWLERKRLL